MLTILYLLNLVFADIGELYGAKVPFFAHVGTIGFKCGHVGWFQLFGF